MNANIDIRKIFRLYPIDSILIKPIQSEYIIIDVNDSCLNNTQSKLADWVDKNVFTAFPVNPNQPYIKDKTDLKNSLDYVIKTKKSHKILEQRYFIPNALTQIPEERFAEIENTPIMNEKNEVELILQTIIDQTKNKYLTELETLEREILKMNASGKSNLVEVLKSYLFGIEQIHAGMICSILEVKNNRVFDLASSSLPHEYLELISGLEIGENEGSCGTAAFLKETVIVSDISNDFRWYKYREIAQQFKLRACWSTPIIDTAGNVIATFANYYRETKEPNTNEEVTIKRAGHIIQIILEGYLKNKQVNESEKKFRSLVSNMEVGVLLQGPKAEILLCNPKSLELLGLTEDQLLGKTSFDKDWNVIREDGSIFQGSNHPVPQAIEQKKAINNVVMGVYRPKSKDRVWLLVDAEPTLNESGEVLNVVCTFIDITERKLAEEEIKKSKSTYRGILNSISEFIFILDDNACFIDVNVSAQNFYGYSKEEFIGKTPAFLAAPGLNDMEMIIGAISQTWSGVKQNFEFWAVTKEGKIFPKNVSLSLGTYFGKQIIIAVGRDISESKLYENNLTSSNSILNATIESTNNGILVVNTEGIILKHNENFSKLWRIPEDILNTSNDKKLLSFILNQLTKPEEFLAKVNELYGQPYSESIDEIYFKDGRIFERISKPMFINGEPKGRVWSFEDISHRIKVENELIENNTRLNGIITGTRSGTWEWNIQTGEIIFNDRWAEIIGYTLDELMPISVKTWIDRIHEEDFKKSDKILGRHFKGELDYYEFEMRIRHKDGSWVWILDRGKVVSWTEDGKPLMMFGTHQDITERKKADDALYKSEKKYRQLIESTNEGIVVAQGPYLKFVNSVVMRMMGRTEAELTQVPFLDYVHKEDRMIVRKNYLKRISEDNAISKFQFRIIAKNSNIRWIEMSGIVINWNGQPAALNFMTDITENFEYLKAIEEQNKKLNDIAWTQSHMVRAPLARMMGLINLLQHEGKTDDKTKDFLTNILDSAHELDNIIKSIVQNTQQRAQ